MDSTSNFSIVGSCGAYSYVLVAALACACVSNSLLTVGLCVAATNIPFFQWFSRLVHVDEQMLIFLLLALVLQQQIIFSCLDVGKV